MHTNKKYILSAVCGVYLCDDGRPQVIAFIEIIRGAHSTHQSNRTSDLHEIASLNYIGSPVPIHTKRNNEIIQQMNYLFMSTNSIMVVRLLASLIYKLLKIQLKKCYFFYQSIYYYT